MSGFLYGRSSWSVEERCALELVGSYEIPDEHGEAWLRGRERCLTDLYFLCTEVLGYRQFYEPLHRPMCEFVQDMDEHSERITSLVVPRGCFKSTIGIGGMIQALARNPDERIGFFHSIKDMGVEYLDELKNHLESNSTLKWLFPDVFYADPVRESKTWLRDAIRVKRRRENKVPSIMVGGVDSSKTGFHFSKLVTDDISSDKNCETQEMREKVRVFRRNSFATVEEQETVRGLNLATVWHPDDATVDMIKGSRGEGDWAGEVRSFGKPGVWYRAIRELPDGTPDYENGKSIFPTRFTEPVIERLRKTLGSYRFSAHYMNNPTPEGVARFRRSDVLWYRLGDDGLPPISESYEVYMGVDPNRSEKTTGDPSAVVVAAWTASGHLWLLQIVQGHENWTEFVKTLTDAAQRWQPREILIEENSAQIQLKTWLETGLMERGLFSKVVPFSSSRANRKVDRIMALQGLFESKRLHVLEGMDKFVKEAEQWTGMRDDRDDQLDALAFIFQRVRQRPASVVVKEREKRKDEAVDVLAEAGLGFILGGGDADESEAGGGRSFGIRRSRLERMR